MTTSDRLVEIKRRNASTVDRVYWPSWQDVSWLTGEIDDLRSRLALAERDNVIYRACANGFAESALRALMELTGSYNSENPWLGVTAAVALLQTPNATTHGKVNSGELLVAAKAVVEAFYNPQIVSEATFNSLPRRAFVALSGLKEETEGRRANVTQDDGQVGA